MNARGPWLPHDLLWGMRPEQLPADAPHWAREVLAAGQPVVVRRALTAPGLIAVGLRGVAREQRYAALLELSRVQRGVRPEDLCRVQAAHCWPALRALQQLCDELDATGLVWGVSGSAGYELATGVAAVHQHSDLDLILRTPEAFSRARARELLARLERAECRVDVQLQVPDGALALREWAGVASRVLLKSASGAHLVDDPWAARECVA